MAELWSLKSGTTWPVFYFIRSIISAVPQESPLGDMKCSTFMSNLIKARCTSQSFALHNGKHSQYAQEQSYPSKAQIQAEENKPSN